MNDTKKSLVSFSFFFFLKEQEIMEEIFWQQVTVHKVFSKHHLVNDVQQSPIQLFK